MFIILMQCQELKLAFIVFIRSYFKKKILLTKKCKKRVRINKMEEVLIDKMPFFFLILINLRSLKGFFYINSNCFIFFME